MSGGSMSGSYAYTWAPHMDSMIDASGHRYQPYGRMKCAHCGNETIFMVGDGDKKCKSCGSRKWEAERVKLDPSDTMSTGPK